MGPGQAWLVPQAPGWWKQHLPQLCPFPGEALPCLAGAQLDPRSCLELSRSGRDPTTAAFLPGLLSGLWYGWGMAESPTLGTSRVSGSTAPPYWRQEEVTPPHGQVQVPLCPHCTLMLLTGPAPGDELGRGLCCAAGVFLLTS